MRGEINTWPSATVKRLMHDLRHAVRSLRNQPLFTLAAALTLALGIGANTAIFSVLYQAVLRPLPYKDPDRLVFVWNSYPRGGGDPTRVSIPDYLDRRAGAPALEDAALFTPHTATLSSGDRPQQLLALAVTPSFFSTLGRDPVLGRGFTPEQARPGADRAVILTYATWMSDFAGDRSVVGRHVRLDGEPYAVTGVLPRDFELPWRGVSLLVPFAFTPAQTSDEERGNEFSLMIGRLRHGATIRRLDGEMQALVGRLIDRLPARAAYMRNSGFTGVATPLADELAGDVRTPLYLLQAGVLLVLLIACANVANLLLMRASGRRQELAIRVSLGAGPWHIVRQLLAEGAVLSAAGAAGGALMGVAGVRGLTALAAEQLPEMAPSVLQPAILAFTLALATLTTVALAVAPALSVFGGGASALKENPMRGSPGRRSSAVRSTLVVAETALAVVMLVAAGLLVKGFVRLARVDPGFSPSHVLTAAVSLPEPRYGDPVAIRQFWSRLLDDVRDVPGVAAAGLVSTVPLSGSLSSGTYRVVGRTSGPTEKPPHGRLDQVSGDYFRVMGIPLVEGRPFDDRDTFDSPRVVIVDRLLARRQFPGRPALGERLNFRSARNYTIVGVVGSIRDADLAQPVTEGRVYFDASQMPLRRMALVVRTGVEPTSLVSPLRTVVRTIDPEQALGDVRTMDGWITRSLGGRRTPMALLAVFGAVALALALVGIYGVVAFGVTERYRELGIRKALGADTGAILTLVFVHGLRTVGAGVALGLVLSWMATRSVQSLLFGVGRHDPVVFAGVAVLLTTTAAVACYLPARRATEVDPMVALRDG